MIILRRESDAPHQRHKTRVGAAAVPDGFDIERVDVVVTILDRLLQPRQRLLFPAQMRIEDGDVSLYGITILRPEPGAYAPSAGL